METINIQRYTREDTLAAMIDCFGYSESDFEDFSKAELWDYLEDWQKLEILYYLG